MAQILLKQSSLRQTLLLYLLLVAGFGCDVRLLVPLRRKLPCRHFLGIAFLIRLVSALYGRSELFEVQLFRRLVGYSATVFFFIETVYHEVVHFYDMASGLRHLWRHLSADGARYRDFTLLVLSVFYIRCTKQELLCRAVVSFERLLGCQNSLVRFAG